MKVSKISSSVTLVMTTLLCCLGAFTCSKQTQPETKYVGTWATSVANIQIRTKTGVMKYQFTPVTIPVNLHIGENGTATCTIGDVQLKNLALLKNPGNSDKTGIIYTLRCGEVGKINNNGPSNKKELELWIKPLTTDNKLLIEIREMHALDAFPMGEAVLEKQ